MKEYKIKIVECIVKKWIILTFLYVAIQTIAVMFLFGDKILLAIGVVLVGTVTFSFIILFAYQTWYSLWRTGEITSERSGFRFLLTPRPYPRSQDKQDYHAGNKETQEN